MANGCLNFSLRLRGFARKKEKRNNTTQKIARKDAESRSLHLYAK